MKPRYKIGGFVLVTLGVLGAGLGARTYQHQEPPLNPGDPRAYCTTNLEKVFEICAPDGEWSGCGYPAYAQEGYQEACVAGCVMAACPEQVHCTGHDPIWCAPCTDMHGAAFWARRLPFGRKCTRPELDGVPPDEIIYYAPYPAAIQGQQDDKPKSSE